jgi:uncharacterized integral membrane protein
MNYVKLGIVVFVIILAVTFAKNNAQPVTIAYYFGWETPPFDMYLLIFIPFFIGLVVGSLVGFGSRLNLKNTIRKLHKSKGELEEKLKQAQEAQISEEYETPMLEEGSTDTEVISTT